VSGSRTGLQLQHEHGGNLLSYGCGGLAYELARHRLVDEILFGFILSSGAHASALSTAMHRSPCV
jgi:hypothetical protein